MIPEGSNLSPDEKIETTIGSTASLQGVLKAEGTIRIDGAFEGEIETAANVIIGRTGKVLANIHARNVLVAGRVKGNINALERLEILKDGGVKGDIDAGTLYLEEGAIFHGQSRMRSDETDDRFLLEGPKESIH
ncbi:MAG: polymer-forming cytoskeletal protein [Chloroflexi bacterium]|nr:polymer-forming cytoskeletal protein [Chloroflexota bacterium]